MSLSHMCEAAPEKITPAHYLNVGLDVVQTVNEHIKQEALKNERGN